MFQNNTIIALIDFDNFYPHVRQYYDFGFLVHEFNRIVGEALDIDASIEYVIIRLYGGWMEYGLLTPLASLIQQEISRAHFFPLTHPKKSGLLRGNIILATSLISLPSMTWENTRKQRNGLPRLRLDRAMVSEVCETNTERCPIKILERFSKKRGKLCSIPGCSLTNDTAFRVVEQKMVDVILSCDILFLADQPNVSSIIILSDDFDIHPAIALASAKSQKNILLSHNNPQQAPEIEQSFKGMSVKLKNWRN